MPLDLSSLRLATASLQRGLDRTADAPDDAELRDCVIQRFEYTYELCWKMLKRQLEADAPTPAAIDALGFRDLMREGAQAGLLDAPERWFVYREQRNITAHTYNETKALSVFQTAREFHADAVALLRALEAKNAR